MDPDLRRDIRFLTSLLGRIIQEQEGPRFFQRIERIRALAKAGRMQHGQKIQELRRLIERLPIQTALKVARAFTIYFQLVNLAEEAQRIRRIDWYQSQEGPGLEMSLKSTAHRLKAAGVTPAALLKSLQEAEVTPVLTAHPTEVRRRTTMDHLMDIARALELWSHSSSTPPERRKTEQAILETLEILWNSNESRLRKLNVEDEVSQTLFFIERTILGLIPELYEGLDDLPRALNSKESHRVPTFLRFGSWVGADRDGNPYVTPETTWQTAQAHRKMILGHYRLRLEDLIRRFSQAETLIPASRSLKASLEKDRRELSDAAKVLARYEGSEYFRKKLSFMHTRIFRSQEGQSGGYRSAQEMIRDLQLIQSSLKSKKSRHAAGEMDQLIRQVETFGFFLARLEYREHRDRILQAVGELLPKTIKHSPAYEGLSETDRLALLQQALVASRKRQASDKGLSAVAQDLLGQFRTMDRIQKELDPDLARTYLVSMTRSPSDILAVLFLGSLAGLVRGLWAQETSRAAFDAVPLFETIPDLNRSEEMMNSLWNDPVYRRYLAARGMRQEVMLGYSDANKDGGYLAANWALYRTQAKLGRAAEQAGVKLVLFHGKGGSIDRGGGLSHRAIVAQPFAAPGCRIKITEQGEVVAAKYSHPIIARRNIEQLVSAVLLANLVKDGTQEPSPRLQRWEQIMEELAEISERAYRSCIFEDPDFVRYYTLATPIQTLLEQPVAGTRPGARSGDSPPAGHSASQGIPRGTVPFKIAQLRAIPWVFSWVQSRHMISAWYGIGSAIETFQRRHGDAGLQELIQMNQAWPFAHVLWENAQASLSKADLKIAQAYASLVHPLGLRNRIFRKIRGEYDMAVRGILKITGQRTLLEHQPVLRHSILLRNPYVDPLHILQVRALQELQGSSASAAGWQELTRLTIHGIAYGMKSTG